MTMTLTQILNLVGKLDDAPGDGSPRARFRTFLKEDVKDLAQIRDYVVECLETSGDQYNRSLQDLVNFVGVFLKFDVTYGRYAGVQGQNGFDGHWKSPTGFHIVTEIKTTDAYAIKTSTLMGYIDGLISDHKIPSRESCLGIYVVGRPDAELKQLENAIIAEKRTDQLRVISVESLLSLAEMMSDYDVTHEDILDVLRPSGPRIDPVVTLMTRLVAESRETSGVSAPQQPETPGAAQYWIIPVQSHENETAEECIDKLVGKQQIFGFGEKTPGRKHMKPGDQICFYATTKGIVAHATITSAPQRRKQGIVTGTDEYPWICSLGKQSLYLEQPVVIDAALRQQLEAFKATKPEKSWAWFVQCTHKVSAHDFALLTKTKQK